MTKDVFEAIMAKVRASGAAFRHVEHEPTRTSEESAAARGESTDIGGKSLVLKAGGEFRLLVLSASRRASSAGLRRAFAVRRIRFARREELAELTGLVPGCVPPFGRPILPLPLYVDVSTLRQERIAFNAASLTDSLILRVEDWRAMVDIASVVDVGEAP